MDIALGLAINVVLAALLLFAGWIVAGWVRRRIVKTAEARADLDDTLFRFLAQIVWYAILAVIGLAVLGLFGIQTTSIVALIGAAGLAVGLALQGVLGNLAAGVMLVLFRPFKLGDFVTIAGQTGTVKEISLNHTEIADMRNVQVIIPNSAILAGVIVNFSANDLRRLEWTFGVGYGANLAEAEAVIRDTIFADPRALAEPAPWVQVSTLGDSSVDFLVRVWCKSADAWDFQTDMTRAIKEAFDRRGIQIPFPTRTVITSAGGAAAD